MKKAFIFFAASSFMGITIASAQADSINNTTDRANTYSGEKAQQTMLYRDSVKNAKVVTPAEKQALNKDYPGVRKDYNTNRELVKDEKYDKSIRNSESLSKYRMDRKEYKGDRRSLKRQKRDYYKANADGVITPQERAAIEAKYKHDRVHYLEDKNKLNNNQKPEIRDSSNNPH